MTDTAAPGANQTPAQSSPAEIELSLRLIECFKSNEDRDEVQCEISYRFANQEKPIKVVYPVNGSWKLTAGQSVGPNLSLYEGKIDQELRLEIHFFEEDGSGVLPALNDRLGGMNLVIGPDHKTIWTAHQRTAHLGRLSEGRQVFQLLGANAEYQVTLVLFQKIPL